jgi:hypothetical protein
MPFLYNPLPDHFRGYVFIHAHTLSYFSTDISRGANQVFPVIEADAVAFTVGVYPDGGSHVVRIIRQDDLRFQEVPG